MIAIKNMEMPKSCWDCPILCKENEQCKVSEKYIYGNDIPADCPLVEIITCKDCDNQCTEGSFCTKRIITVTKDFYCADGERKK